MTTEPPPFHMEHVLAPLKCRWWVRLRPCRLGVQLPPAPGDTPCLPCQEFYVPWWAWPLELVDRLFRSRPRLIGEEIISTTRVPAGHERTILITRKRRITPSRRLP